MLRHLCDAETSVFLEKSFQPAVRKRATDLLLSGKAASGTVLLTFSIATVATIIAVCCR